MYEKRHIEFLLRENNVANYWQLKLKAYKQNMNKVKIKITINKLYSIIYI